MNLYNCNPIFPPGTSIDTHYLVTGFQCEQPCDCPVEERPAPEPKTRSYGTISVQDGVYTYEDQPLQNEERRGFARHSEDNPEIIPKIQKKSSYLKSFSLDLNYKDYKYVYHQGNLPLATNIPIEYNKNILRISSGKNVIGDMKNLLQQYSSCEEAFKVRKRAIALSRIHNSISDEVFRFGIQDL